jgi:hypothetical protein
LALLAGLGGLAVSHDWQSDGLGMSNWLGWVTDLSSTQTLSASAEPEAATKTAEEPGANAASVESIASEVERGKTVATTKLDVENTSGEALHYIPLKIRAVASPGMDRPAIKLSNLPTETLLTSGEDLGNGSWLLKPGEEEDLKLAVQTNAPGEIVIGVEAIEMKTGELAAPPQELRVRVSPPRLLVQPAADTIKPAPVPAAALPAVKPPPVAAKIEAPPELPALPVVEDSAPEPQAEVVAAQPAAAATTEVAAMKPVSPPPPPPPEAEVVVQPAAAPKVEMEVADEPPAAVKTKVTAPDIAVPAPKAEVKIAAVDPLIVSTMTPATAAPAASGDPTLISRGDSLMAIGEIIGARSFYNRAYDRGDVSAARYIARTYDPVVYVELKVMGLKPNAEKALEWYRKAEAGGVSAAADIAALEAFLAK